MCGSISNTKKRTKNIWGGILEKKIRIKIYIISAKQYGRSVKLELQNNSKDYVSNGKK
jgi:hypothetical protein